MKNWRGARDRTNELMRLVDPTASDNEKAEIFEFIFYGACGISNLSRN
jgi:hypothetical protein